MAIWEWIAVAVIVLGAGGWLIWYYANPKRRQKVGPCSGNCSECSMMNDKCLDPELRDRLRRGSFPEQEKDENKND